MRKRAIALMFVLMLAAAGGAPQAHAAGFFDSGSSLWGVYVETINDALRGALNLFSDALYSAGKPTGSQTAAAASSPVGPQPSSQVSSALSVPAVAGASTAQTIPNSASPAISITVTGISPAEFAARLALLESGLASLRAVKPIIWEGARHAIGNNAAHNTLNDLTVNGVAGLTDADIPDAITASNYLPLTGGSLTGDLAIGGTLTAGTLSVAGLSSSGAITVPWLSATSTTATSTFAGGLAVTGFTDLATTTITGGLTVNGNTNITQGGQLTVGDKIIAPGEIGLGTSTPGAKLAIQSTNANQTVLLLYGAAGQASPLLDIYSNAGANLLKLSAAGALSISSDLTVAGNSLLSNATTTSLFVKGPTSALSAAFGATATSTFSTAGALTLASALTVGNGGTGAASFAQGWLYSSGGTAALAASTSPTVNYLTATSTTATTTIAGMLAVGSNALNVLSNGNVGIGTAAPTTVLQVSATAPVLRISPAGNNIAKIDFRPTGGNTTFAEITYNDTGADLSLLQEFSVGNLIFGTNSTERMRITNAGNVGIGTTTPQALLHIVSSGANSHGTLEVSDGVGGSFVGILSGASGVSVAPRIEWKSGTDLTFSTASAILSGLSDKMVLTSTGLVGIGTTTPTNKLDIYSATKAALSFSGAAAGQWTMGYDVSNGRFSIASSTALGTNDRFVINGSGNVGIGTANPAYTLDVTGSAHISSGLTLAGGLTSTSGSAVGDTFTDTYGVVIMNAQSTSVAGSHPNSFLQYLPSTYSTIGNAARDSYNFWLGGGGFSSGFPTQTVIGSPPIYARARIDPDTFSAGSAQTITTGATLYIGSAPANGTNVTVTNPFALYVNNGNSYFGGNVGIGTASPTSGKLQVERATAGIGIFSNLLATSGSNYAVDGEAQGSGATLNVGGYFAANAGTSNYAIQIPTGFPGVGANNYAIRSDSLAQSYFAGNVGIGDTSPAALLTVGNGDLFTVSNLGAVIINGASSYLQQAIDGAIFYAGSSNANNDWYLKSYDGTAWRSAIHTANANVTLVDEGVGNVGVATTSPWKTLSVNGGVSFAGLTGDTADAKTLCLTAANEVVANTGSTCITSSQRFKTDIAPLDDASGLDEVLQLRPVTYAYKPEIGVPGTQVGFIAEDMQIIDPRLVVLDASSTPFTVRYENLTAILAKAIQELAAKLNDLSNAVSGFAQKFTTHELCVDDVCVTRDQFLRMVQQSQQGTQAPPTEQGSASSPAQTPPAEQVASPAPSAPAPLDALGIEPNELEESSEPAQPVESAPDPLPSDVAAAAGN